LKLLKVQRDALVQCSLTLELMDCPQFVLGHKNTSSAMEVHRSDLSRLQVALKKARRRAREIVVTPQTIKLCLLWTEARLLLFPYGCHPDTPAEVVKAHVRLGMVHAALALANTLEEDVWTLVVKPFLQLCIEGDENPTCVGELADDARGNFLSHMYLRHDSSEPLGLASTVAEGGGLELENCSDVLWLTLHKLAVLTNTVVEVANELLTIRPDAPLPLFIINELCLYKKTLATKEDEEEEEEENLLRKTRWVTLLRLYMKHHRAEDCVRLLETQLGRIASANEHYTEIWRRKTYCPSMLCRQLRTALRENQEEEAVERLDRICTEFSQILVN